MKGFVKYSPQRKPPRVQYHESKYQWEAASSILQRCPIRDFWRETVSLQDVMWPRSNNNQWEHAPLVKRLQQNKYIDHWIYSMTAVRSGNDINYNLFLTAVSAASLLSCQREWSSKYAADTSWRGMKWPAWTKTTEKNSTYFLELYTFIITFNCFSIVWGQGKAPLVNSLPNSCY